MRLITSLFALLFVLTGCPNPTPFDDDAVDDDTGGGDDDDADDDTTPTDICDDFPGESICDGDTEVICDAYGDIASTEDCDVAADYYCFWGMGCVMCYPEQRWCEGDSVVECDANGQAFSVVEVCDTANGETCSGGVCVSLCELAETERSSIGCKFYGVDMEQYPGYQGLQYAIVVSNVNDTTVAHVTVEDKTGGTWTVVAQADINPQDLEAFALTDHQTTDTSIRAGAAYRVTSSIPVIAYQFNPLDNGSATSDASLLLPASALDTVYVATAWGSVPPGDSNDSSLLNVVAEVDGTQVWITPSVNTAGGAGVPAGTAGVQFGPITLDEGDVLQVVNDPGSAFAQNIEGTLVEASERVAVFGGHQCANVPTNVYACDHVEEMVFGLQTWGQAYVGARMPVRASGTPEVSYWHFLAGDTATDLTFEASPNISGLPPGNVLSLGPGQASELTITGTMADPGDFIVSGTEAFLVTQYMAGDDIANDVSTGDPCMVQSVPVEQYLDNYVVLVPNSWDPDFLTLTRQTGELVDVDGTSVDNWMPWSEIVTVNAQWEVVRIDVEDGTHVLSGTAPFGVIVSGADSYDSYCYPGGLNQEIINDL